MSKRRRDSVIESLWGLLIGGLLFGALAVVCYGLFFSVIFEGTP